METPKHFERKIIEPYIVDRTQSENRGYNECLEKTNAKELYEALQYAKREIERAAPITGGGSLYKINQALDNANK